MGQRLVEQGSSLLTTGTFPLAMGDLIAAEVLQGVCDEREFKWVKKTFDAFDHVDLAGYELTAKASENYRPVRARGSRSGRPPPHGSRPGISKTA